MRPQRNAAENCGDGAGVPGRRRASMRPQRNAAENGRGIGGGTRRPQCFNEAAA